MKTLVKLAAVCALLALPADAAPEIRAILNAASYALPGTPNSGIAQGSMFVVFGADLGPRDLRQANGFPLPTSMGGTSIRITAGTTTVDALLVYVSATQVAAILPSATPEGTGLMAVTYNGHTSQSGAFSVVKSSPGILTQNQAGAGIALAQNFASATDQPRNSLSRPARPGQVVTLWGTGLGPVPGDESLAPVPRDLDMNLQVLVGGKPATVRYKGRSGCCPGIDQVVFEVPAGLSGCYVPLVVQAGAAVGNFTTISVAAPGADCADLSGIPGPALESLQAGQSLRVGSIALRVSRQDFVTETGTAEFYQADLNWLANRISLGLPSPGSCLVNPLKLSAGSGFSYWQMESGLDAGLFLNVSGPKGARQVLQRATGIYNEVFANGTLVQYLDPGTYTVDNVKGGVDVGPFKTTLAVPAPLTAAVKQSTAGTTVSWTGGDPAGYVVIQGSAQSPTTGTKTDFSCTERVTAGQFNVPSYVLSSLPAAPTGITVLSATGSSPQNRFQAPGLTFGFINFCTASSSACGFDYYYGW